MIDTQRVRSQMVELGILLIEAIGGRYHTQNLSMRVTRPCQDHSTSQIAALRSALETILADIEPVCLTCGCVENDHAETGECRNCGIADCGGFRLADDIKIAREALAATPADPVKGDKADLTFAERAEKFRTERNQAWQDFREDSKAAGYTIEDNLANRTLFLSGYESGKSARPDPVREAATALVETRSCNRHSDCSKREKSDFCCRDEDCEDCFGK